MTVGEVAKLMARIEDDKVNVVQPKAAAVAADEAAAQAQAGTPSWRVGYCDVALKRSRRMRLLLCSRVAVTMRH